MNRAPKIRQNLYIDREIGDALEALAKGRAGNKSRLVNDALSAWIRNRGISEADAALRMRLNELTKELAGARRDIDILLESYSLVDPILKADSDAIACESTMARTRRPTSVRLRMRLPATTTSRRKE